MKTRIRAAATAAAAALALLSAAAGATERRFVMTADGLGPIRRDAPVDLTALKDAYPEFEFRSEIAFKEGIAEEQIFATENGAPAFEVTVFEGRFYDITSVSPRIVGPLGGRPGVKIRDLQRIAAETCFPMAEGSPYVACSNSDDERLQYLFVRGEKALDGDSAVAGLRVY